jgi:phage terminase large subunit
MLTETEEIEYLELLEQDEREKVIPKLECFRKPARYKLALGGRGSGKSRGIGSLLCQLAQNKPLKILCTREVQLSLEESVYAVIVETLAALKYEGWTVTKEAITHANGSRFIFRGLKDLRAANAVKSMEGIDICWIEEAQSVSEESLKVLVPTIRSEGSEIWASWNPETDNDPIMAYTYKSDAIVAHVNWNDNPWFPDVLKKEMEDDFLKRHDEAEHIWNGQPRKQGDNCVFSRTAIRDAMERVVKEEGATEIGLDVARFGGDTTQGYKRKGMKTTDHFELMKADTNQVVDRLFTFAGGSSGVLCKIDEGYNPGVVDVAKSRGINVDAISFGGAAGDGDLYPNKISEMWFTFPIHEAQIPNDPEIMEQMSDRRYKYDNKGRRCIESKDEYKKRHGGKSPDKIDALLLCYYVGSRTTFDTDFITRMEKARNQ